MIVLDVKDVHARYGTTTILEGISFEVEQGGAFCLTGRNGMGKTTLVKCLTRLHSASAGTISIQGKDVHRLPPHRVIRFGVGYAPQEHGVFDELTVRTNLDLSNGFGRAKPGEFELLMSALPELADRLELPAGRLSGGQQKLLMFARAILGRPDLVVLDEISEGVQPGVLVRIAQMVQTLRAEHGMTFLIVEQNLEFLLSLGTRFAVVASGQIVESGDVDASARQLIEKHLVL